MRFKEGGGALSRRVSDEPLLAPVKIKRYCFHD